MRKNQREAIPMNTTSSNPPIISDEEMKRIFLAKCQDFNLSPNDKLFARFLKHRSSVNKRKTFSLENCSLGPLSAAVVAEIVFDHPDFRVLSLTGNNIGDNGAYEIANLINQTETLISINLSSNSIGDSGASEIFKSLLDNKTLVNLSIGSVSGVSRNYLGINSLTQLSKMLLRNKVLSDLDLSMTEITADTIEPMIVGLSANQTLRVLNLSNNNIQSKGSILVFSNCVNSQLEELYFSNNLIKDDIAPYVDNFLKQNRSVKILDLSGNQLTHRFTTIISSSLGSGSTLEGLNLSRNPIGARGIIPLGSALAKNKSLKKLSIYGCKIQTSGFVTFCKQMQNNTSLVIFECQKNPIRDDGATSLSEVIDVHPSLREINLELCEISDEGAKNLFNAISKSESIEKISIKNNLIRKGEPIQKAVGENHKIMFLNIEYNDIDFKIYEDIQKLTKSNLKRWKDSQKERVANQVEVLQNVNADLDEVRQQIVEEREMIEILTRKYLEAQDSLLEAEKSSKLHLENLDQQFNDICLQGRNLVEEYRIEMDKLRTLSQEKEMDITNQSNHLQREQENYKMDSKTLSTIEAKIAFSTKENVQTLEELDRKLEESKRMYKDMKLMLISAFSLAKEPKEPEIDVKNEKNDDNDDKKAAKTSKGKKGAKKAKKEKETKKEDNEISNSNNDKKQSKNSKKGAKKSSRKTEDNKKQQEESTDKPAENKTDDNNAAENDETLNNDEIKNNLDNPQTTVSVPTLPQEPTSNDLPAESNEN